MMRLKRYIALLLTAVYLFAAGGSVFASLTCRCITGDLQGVHICCRHCDHKSVPAVLAEHCCGDAHSTDIVLYTAPSNDSTKFIKRAVATESPAALVADRIVSTGTFPLGCCNRIISRGVGAVPDSFVSSCGLRAPPALV